jgi:hypothetical protein
MTREEIHKLPWKAQEYINKLERKLTLTDVGCSFCEEIPKVSFYLGQTCEQCNKPFRVVKNKQ